MMIFVYHSHNDDHVCIIFSELVPLTISMIMWIIRWYLWTRLRLENSEREDWTMKTPDRWTQSAFHISDIGRFFKNFHFPLCWDVIIIPGLPVFLSISRFLVLVSTSRWGRGGWRREGTQRESSRCWRTWIIIVNRYTGQYWFTGCFKRDILKKSSPLVRKRPLGRYLSFQWG